MTDGFTRALLFLAHGKHGDKSSTWPRFRLSTRLLRKNVLWLLSFTFRSYLFEKVFSSLSPRFASTHNCFIPFHFLEAQEHTSETVVKINLRHSSENRNFSAPSAVRHQAQSREFPRELKCGKLALDGQSVAPATQK